MVTRRSSGKAQTKRFQALLLDWYDAHARDLPWRATSDPYNIWVSEIMLQQTRVAAVIVHYHEFLRLFPTVQKLAAARESSVLAAWSGLGYYRRARMLQAAAKVIAGELGGVFPRTSSEWRELPGIGRYTAAAIASIAFGEAIAVVDGNVERVLRRLAGKVLAGQEVWATAEGMLYRNRPGDFNQAMMELGATVCTPRAPACLMCPVTDLCRTRGELRGDLRKSSQRKREVDYALDLRNGAVFMVQRPSNTSLMAGMWELPEIAPPGDCGEPALVVRHSITVTDYQVRVWYQPTDHASHASGKWIERRNVHKLPLTGLARKILRKEGLMEERPRHGKAK
ncbi:MAG TPA: A/G-specific adenine glycosylase [Candidatus Sulfotelmatobacter sp.]|nr:A/G-specific adenine glycosylase [Candidatus Sulfotelmatobacter sp.]